MQDYLLLPWADSSPYGDGRLLLHASAAGYKLSPCVMSLNDVTVSGRYINYPEGRFGFFVDKDQRICLFFRGMVLPLSEVASMTHRIGWRKRELSLQLQSGKVILFKYLGIGSLLIRPELLLDMLLLDMWELQFDLPSWVKAEFNRAEDGRTFPTFAASICHGQSD
ncbi:hypothetical protein [Acinetobacter shaoyimingii]|uniref:Uncharacterized protein n=1 Tax=Acinetobacter shaoyimingii TaxID=2715164 RepID=A0A6G8RTI1_9GAMM|nr:hypothetical protein [Acinetobacter shaoyimingii]QIO05236.1 hypothetical protein G8E00_04285 [Acinetobacter shaoyimingii]